MPDTDLCYLTATELARRIREKDVSTREVLDAHLAQIDRINPTVNAIVSMVPEQAIATATAADEALARGKDVGVLHGLPIAHKDLIDTKGIVTTQGSPIYADHIPDEASSADTCLITHRTRGQIPAQKSASHMANAHDGEVVQGVKAILIEATVWCTGVKTRLACNHNRV